MIHADQPNRKAPIHFPPAEVGNRSIIIFLTLCTRGRRHLLARPEVHASLLKAWNASSHWLVGRYVIMPDHIHLFCAPNELIAKPLSLWIAYWRNLISRE